MHVEERVLIVKGAMKGDEAFKKDSYLRKKEGLWANEKKASPFQSMLIRQRICRPYSIMGFIIILSF